MQAAQQEPRNVYKTRRNSYLFLQALLPTLAQPRHVKPEGANSKVLHGTVEKD